MKIIASLNDQVIAVAALQGHGLLTASILSLRRNPERQLAGHSDALLVPELRLRLGGVRQAEEGDAGFTVLECALAPGDTLTLALKPESGGSETLLAPAREIWLPAEAPRLDIGVEGRISQIIGQPGFGMLSALLVWANRHPARCQRRGGGELPQHQLQMQLAAQDNNAPNVTVQHHWHSPALSPVDVIRIGLLPAGDFEAPTESREHWH
jgi:hypothetical protein